jgi:ADP-dependent NAD(P)H-hydrate dehydratase
MPADGVTEVSAKLLREWPLPPPGKDKESRGRVLVVGGTAHTPGAVLLAGEAALRAGAGKLQVATPEPVAAQLAVAVPEAMVVPLATTREGDIAARGVHQIVSLAQKADAVLAGPGFADVARSTALLSKLVPQLETPLVLDALASAYIGENRDGLGHLAPRCVLTVNLDELARTLGTSTSEVEQDPGGMAAELACETKAVVLCGGEGKWVADPSRNCWQIRTGGPGLGVSGSGDVQAGLVAGLLARGAEPVQAAVWAGYVHGRCGELLATQFGEVGFLARELPGQAPGILRDLAGGEAKR